MTAMPLTYEQTRVPAPALIPPVELWPIGTRWIGNSSEKDADQARARYEPWFIDELVVLVARPWAPEGSDVRWAVYAPKGAR